MQRFAEYIRFTSADFTTGCLILGSVGNYWHGQDPEGSSGWQVWLDATHYDNCACLGNEAEGIAASTVSVLDTSNEDHPNDRQHATVLLW
jgi:hypothetical protein